MSIENIIQNREITEILHFTTHKGLVGTLASRALQSRHRLPADSYLQHILHVNAVVRPEASEYFDKSQNWLDFVNLSISEINRRYFEVSERWHDGDDVWWAILAFNPVIMTHDSVVFATTNNTYDRCFRSTGRQGLEAVFAPVVRRKSPSWTVSRFARLQNLPTCEQAEVLYPGAVLTEFLVRVYVREEEHQDQVSGWLEEFGLSGVEVVWSPAKFVGKKN